MLLIVKGGGALMVVRSLGWVQMKCSQSACLMPAAKGWEGAVTYRVGLQAIFDFMERDRTPEVVKMHVEETLQLTPEQVNISANYSLPPIDQNSML